MIDGFTNWLREPFRSNMSAADWFLFVGLLLVVMFLWRLILMHLAEAMG